MKVAVLLNGPLENDYRVIKTVSSISRYCEVHVFYVGSELPDDHTLVCSTKIQFFPVKRKNTTFNKILRHSFFCYEYLYLYRKACNQNHKYNVVWANDLPTLLPAFKLASKNKAKLIYDSHEIYNETINQFFPRENTGFKKIIFKGLVKLMRFHGKRCERSLLKKTDLFITVNESLAKYFKTTYGIKEAHAIMNLPRKQEFDSTGEPFNFRKHFSWKEESIVLLYQGSLNEGRGLSIIIETMPILSLSYNLVIIGNGPLKNKLKNKVEQLELWTRVRFIDAVPLNILNSYTKGADVGINLLEDFNLSKKLASPNKLFEYIHSKIPALSTNSIENRKVHERFEIGIVCKNDPSSIQESLSQLNLKNGFQFDQAKNYYNWESQEALLRSFLNHEKLIR